MTKVLQDYLVNKMAKSLDLSRLFDVKNINKNVQTYTYTIPNRTTINTTEDALTDGCGGIQMECGGSVDMTVTADVPLSANRFFGDCDVKDLPASMVNDELETTSKDWATKEATISYSKMTGSVDLSTEVLAATSITDKIKLHIKELVDRGFEKSLIVVAISESVSLDLDASDLTVSDLGVRQDDSKGTAAKKFKVKDIIEVPDKVLSGNVAGTAMPATQQVEIRAYVYDYTRPHRYCDEELLIETVSTETRSKKTRIFGKEYFGFKMYDVANASTVSYEADPAPTL